MGSIKEGIILDMIPLPPSENEAYATDWKTHQRFPSRELKDFKARFQSWSLKRVMPLAELQKELTWELADHRKAVRVDTYMFFQYESLFTKPTTKTEKPRRKKMDPSNRVKVLYDCLAAMLNVDDSRFIPGEVIPILRTDPNGQYCMVKLTYQSIQTDEDCADQFQALKKI